MLLKEQILVWCKVNDEWARYHTKIRVGSSQETAFFRIVTADGSREYYWNPEDCKDHRNIEDDDIWKACMAAWQSPQVTQDIEVGDAETDETESASENSTTAWAPGRPPTPPLPASLSPLAPYEYSPTLPLPQCPRQTSSTG